MSKDISAVIATGGKQYMVKEGETIHIELMSVDDKQVSFEPLLVIAANGIVSVGAPTVPGVSVTADILEEVKNDKVTSIRYKAKKRVHKLRGHRQRMTAIKIVKIA